MSETSETIFNFVVDSLKISGSPYNIINDELVMAQCQVQIPRTFFRPARMETVSLQMVCPPGSGVKISRFRIGNRREVTGYNGLLMGLKNAA